MHHDRTRHRSHRGAPALHTVAPRSSIAWFHAQPCPTGTALRYPARYLFAFLAILMWFYSSRGVEAATSPAAWIYLALHGTYGLVWYLKDKTFPLLAPNSTFTDPKVEEILFAFQDKRIVDAVERAVERYREIREPGERFLDTYRRVGGE